MAQGDFFMFSQTVKDLEKHPLIYILWLLWKNIFCPRLAGSSKFYKILKKDMDMDLREQINIDITQPFFALSVVLTQQLADFRFFKTMSYAILALLKSKWCLFLFSAFVTIYKCQQKSLIWKRKGLNDKNQ